MDEMVELFIIDFFCLSYDKNTHYLEYLFTVYLTREAIIIWRGRLLAVKQVQEFIPLCRRESWNSDLARCHRCCTTRTPESAIVTV